MRSLSSTDLETPLPRPNPLARYRNGLREYAGEFLGTAMIVIFGLGVNCQVTLSSVSGVASSPKGDYTSVAFGWGAGLAIGGWISGCGHINPAVTLAMAVWRGFPWRKVPGYIVAQVFGAWVGAAVVYGNYFHAIDIFEGGEGIRTLKTAGLFGTFALNYMTAASCFFSEVWISIFIRTQFLGTVILVFGVLAITDKKNQVPNGIVPLGLFVLLMGITTCLGMETSFALNPARDFGPRLLTSMVAMAAIQYWIWCPIIATIAGAQFATFIYDLLISSSDTDVIGKMQVHSSTY
ncbi:aquaporin-like protein [Infundibulicybe gibba]|nr:aquaporin-like protein [Infundibulicybe gibba]